MNLSTRIILGVLGAVFSVTGLFIVGSALALIPSVAFDWNGMTFGLDLLVLPLLHRLVWLAVGALMLLLGALGILFGLVHRKKASWIVLKSSDPAIYGDVSLAISKRGLRSLICKAMADAPGVRDSEAELHLSKRGWIIDGVVSVWSEAALPVLGPDVDRRVRTALEKHTGISVARLDIRAQLEPVSALRRVA